jgi:WD40 repeat protein
VAASCVHTQVQTPSTVSTTFSVRPAAASVVQGRGRKINAFELSPDGRLLVLQAGRPDRDVDPHCSSDGRMIAFTSTRPDRSHRT